MYVPQEPEQLELHGTTLGNRLNFFRCITFRGMVLGAKPYMYDAPVPLEAVVRHRAVSDAILAPSSSCCCTPSRVPLLCGIPTPVTRICRAVLGRAHGCSHQTWRILGQHNA